jgi:alkanesulfonate monooxygenase SsuD/methylene tetrahydromethanopterin reductase-like flavin-dependent oxidoreductase (luciferase family)
VHHGIVLPGGTASEQLALAVLAEDAGWDGVFAPEVGYFVDAWALLSAMAVRTERVRLGTMLTPLPWRRPWTLAAQVATLDQLSNGRAVLAVGLGAVDPGLGRYPEVTDLSERAARLDRGIDVVRGLWDGVTAFGDIDISDAVVEAPRPVQDRIPIWCVAVHAPRSMRRLARCDGVVAQVEGVDQLAAMLTWLDDHGGRPGDVIVDGETTGPDDGAAVAPWEAAGATWWLETRWTAPDDLRRRIEAGPVRSTG